MRGEYNTKAGIRIRWQTCIRPDNTSGIIPGSNDKRNVTFNATGGISDKARVGYNINVNVAFLKCEDCKWKKMRYQSDGYIDFHMSSGYTFNDSPKFRDMDSKEGK